MQVSIDLGKDENGQPLTRGVETEVTIQGKTLDVSAVLPLTLGDWHRIKGQYKIDLLSLQANMSVETISNLLLFVFTKLNPDAKLADVHNIPPGRASDLLALIVQAERLDPSTWTRSTS